VLKNRGSWRAQARANEGEPQLETCLPRPPAELTSAGRVVWKRVSRRVGPDGLQVMTRADVGALVRLCELEALWFQTLDRLYPQDSPVAVCDRPIRDKETGLVIGYEERPEVGRLLRIGERLDRAYATFGLTPSDRTRVRALPVASEPEAEPDLE
jgi:P27 family predicted phage terminase small subunit